MIVAETGVFDTSLFYAVRTDIVGSASYHLALFHLEDAKAALLDGGGREVKVFE